MPSQQQIYHDGVISTEWYMARGGAGQSDISSDISPLVVVNLNSRPCKSSNTCPPEEGGGGPISTNNCFVSLHILPVHPDSWYLLFSSVFLLFSPFSLICSKSENLEFCKISRLVRSLASILEPYSISCILVKFRVSSMHIPDISNVAEIEKVIKNMKTSGRLCCLRRPGLS